MSWVDQFDVVLVSPRNPLNIGAAARAMANFGFARLTVASTYGPHWEEAQAAAVDAESVLKTARETATLAEAVADCTLVLGTGTLTYRRPEQPIVPLPELGAIVAAEFERGGRIGLVFGPEKHGLTREDLSYCHRLVVIPTQDEQPSMNLGQAVAVCLYEISTHLHAAETPTYHTASADADSAALERVAELVEEAMRRAGYSPRAMREANRHDLRLMLRRMQLGPKDARRMLGLFRRILARMKPESKQGGQT
ncbi:MAG TPA: RNA methyltransferase [Terracidiphilus sp.]